MKKIQDLRRKKVDLEKSASSWSKENIDKLANIGLHHIEVVIHLDNEIELLKTEESKLDARVKFSKTCFEKFKTEFPF